MEFKNTENDIKEPDSNYLLDKSERQIKVINSYCELIIFSTNQFCFFQKTKVSWILIFTTITISLGCSIPTGYNTGVVNAPALVSIFHFP